MASNEYIEYLCNKPRKLGPRFYDEDYLDLEDEEQIQVDYQTKCCHQDAQKRKFTLNFGIPNDECEESADSQRCKNFWEFIDSEPILSGLIKDGQFIHSNKPFGIGKCSVHKVDTATSSTSESIDPVGLANYKRAQEIRTRENEVMRRRHEKTKALQLKSGQSVFENVPLCSDGKRPEEIFSYMLKDNLDAEFDSMTEYDNELKMKKIFQDAGICWEDDDQEIPGEGESEAETVDPTLSEEINGIDRTLTAEIIKKQSFLKETLDAKACRGGEKGKCRFQFRSGSSDLSGKENSSFCRRAK